MTSGTTAQGSVLGGKHGSTAGRAIYVQTTVLPDPGVEWVSHKTIVPQTGLDVKKLLPLRILHNPNVTPLMAVNGHQPLIPEHV